jgi:7-cyano-7-deazaguanine synthase
MKATVVPNRNKIFASITQAVALSVANRTGENCDIALGIHAGDHSIYPDCRQEFRDADDEAFRLGNWDAERVHYWTPYLLGDKFTILQDGEILCEELGLILMKYIHVQIQVINQSIGIQIPKRL